MADIEISDNAGKSIDGVPDQITSVGSLRQYLLTEPLHLLVVPDLVKIAKDKLTEATKAGPLHFRLAVQHAFQFGASTSPEVGFTPEAKVILAIDTTTGDDLFAQEPFEITCAIPGQTGYLSLSLTGSIELDASIPLTRLTVGFKAGAAATFQYFRAFSLVAGGPTVGEALSETAHGFIVPASLRDLHLLQPNDVAAISGTGSLTLSASVPVTFLTNPLASIDLPLGAGTVALKDGVVANVSASFEVEGSYQLRVQKLDANTVELLYAPERSTTLQLGASLTAGISLKIGDKELIGTLLTAIDAASTPSASLLAQAGLNDEEILVFSKAVKAGISSSLKASINQAFSSLHGHEAAFIYHIDLDRLDAGSAPLVEAALRGNLSSLHRLQASAGSDGAIAPGIRMVKSILGTIQDSKCSVNVNLLGILNFTSLSEFIKKSEVLTDSVTGDVTLKETITGNRISAILEPIKRDEALRKALFDSIVATLLHSASSKTNLDLAIAGLHFALNGNTNTQNLRDYLGWFFAFGLLSVADQESALHQLPANGLSTCLIRAKFDSSRSSTLFLTSDGSALTSSDYIDVGRRALLALLDPVNKTVDLYRKAVLENTDLLRRILDAGASSNVKLLLQAPANSEPIFSDIYFDAQVIAWWALSMADVARSLEQFKTSGSNFDQLGKKMSTMVKNSPARFDQPWALLALSLLTVSERYGKIVAGKSSFERSAALPIGATA